MAKQQQKSLDELILETLDRHGWTLGQFAARTGISLSGLKKLRDGLVETPQSPTVAALARVMGLEPAAIRAAAATSFLSR